jgi:hypothetical protein
MARFVLSAVILLCTAPVLPAQTQEPPAEFFRGINLSGPEVEIDGRKWMAGSGEHVATKNIAFEHQDIPLKPPTDEARARMIRSSIYDRDGKNRVELKGLPPGTYSVLLYVWEDNDSTTYDVFVNGKRVVDDHKSGTGGVWHRLGPWLAEPKDGVIVLTSRGGHANWSGVEIWRGEYSGVPREQEEFFEQKVRPVLLTVCGECHSAKKTSGGLRVDRLASLLAGGDSGPALVPGSPEESLIIDAVRRAEEKTGAMPPEKPLPEHVVADLTKWVEMGAPWPDAHRANVIGPRAKPASEHWAFQPIRDPPAAIRDSSHPIDSFLEAKHVERNLAPLRQADRRTLIRRATFDLTGLPPSPAEIEAFVADESPDAFPRLIDRLLESPHYGEKWGRYWLDLVRYADTAGDNSDYPIPQAYRYRDYVIRAFNEDKPYDQFIQEQVAGDLMPSDSPRQRDERIVATGYIASSRRFGSIVDGYPQHLTIEDTIDNLGRTVLGLTMSCSRCHDHKFDPITQADYYALYGIFASTRYAFPGIELDKKPRDFIPVESFGPGELAYAVADADIGNAKIHIAGNPENLGDEVRRGFPAILGGQTLTAEEAEQSGRLQLGRWLTDPQNPLTARVMMNRIWQYHFGQGLVSTPSDFGVRGARPTHPELLDWLAARFIESGWSIKAMHRLMMTSQAYQRVSSPAEADSSRLARNMEVDPNNDYLWRFTRRRMTAEEIRDTLLWLSAKLELHPPQELHPFPPVDKWNFTQHDPFDAWYDTNHRSVYLMMRRLKNHPFFAVFDGPDRNATTPVRTAACTSLQALFMLNDSFLHEQANGLAERLLKERTSDEDRIELAFALALSRSPTLEERDQSLQFLAQIREEFKTDQSEEELSQTAWRSYIRALLRLNEFLYID